MLLPHECSLKMLRILREIQMWMQNLKLFLTLASPIQPPKPGCWGLDPPRGKFAKPPHVCVEDDQCDEGSFCDTLGYPGPQPGSPLPPPPPPQQGP